MTLYEIDQRLLSCVDEETGEILDDAVLEELEMERGEKIEQIGLWIKDLAAEAEALKAEKMNFAARQQSAEKKVESLKRYLANSLNGDKFKSTRVAISFRKSEAIELDPEAWKGLPDCFLVPTDPKVDKAALKAAVKSGEAFDGVSLVERQNIMIK